MLTARDIVELIIGSTAEDPQPQGDVFAPANIALCKYWGKRDTELNLPLTSSLSVSLGKLGTRCRISFAKSADEIILNGKPLAVDSPFVIRVVRYLDLFRSITHRHYRIETENSIPTAAGFASSASGFAALVRALDALHGWHLPDAKLSILARIGSGSACRSLWQGFVEWHVGEQNDGMDSFAEPLPDSYWPELKIGLLVLNSGQKKIGSRPAMQRTVETSRLYQSWPSQVEADMQTLQRAILERNFTLLGSTAENNALAMHATMLAAKPAVLYWQPESVAAMHNIWNLREKGLPLYFTMDAGPNLKLIFTGDYKAEVLKLFPNLVIAEHE